MTANAKRDNNTSIITYSKRLLTWLGTNLAVGNQRITLILKYCDKLAVILESRGKAEAIRYNKANRLQFLKFIFSLNPEFIAAEKTDRLNRSLRPLTKAITEMKSYTLIRLYLSGLYITRALRTNDSPSFSTIEGKPSHEDSYFLKYQSEMEHFLIKQLGYNPKYIGRPAKSLKFKKFHMSSKSGPNGHALWSSALDNYILPIDLAQAIYFLGGDKLEDHMHKFRLLFSLIPNFFLSLLPRKGSRFLRKISVINDKEGKTREVAIGDYYTQACLKPLHDFLFKLLSRIHQDCTHNQAKLLGKLHLEPGNSFHSIDLSSATDRFPIQIEVLLLKTLFGATYANCWKLIMVKYPFDYKGRKISYATGNPMGLYSSWATFAVCHHFLVYLACKNAKVNWKKCPYMLLGDDIVIANDKVAKEYKELLLLWDVPFSVEKTHSSPYGYEFAKQIILHNENVSPLPLAALFERRNSPIESVGIILREMWTKGWSIHIDQFLNDYFCKIVRWPARKYRSFEPKLQLSISLLAYFQGQQDLGTAVKQYVAHWTKKDWDDSNQLHIRLFAKWLAVKTVQQLFSESIARVTDYSNKLPLGVLAERLVIAITGLETEVDPFSFIESVPFLQIYGRAEETYLKLNVKLNDKGLGSSAEDLRSYIGKVDIPLSDRDFFVRKRDVLLIRALKSSRIIERLIQTTPQVVSWTGRLDFTLPWYKFTKYEESQLLPDRRIPDLRDRDKGPSAS